MVMVLLNLLATPLHVLESERSVVEAAEVTLAARVVPSKVRPLPMRSERTAPEPEPLRIPVRVEEPVPPTFTLRVEVAPRVLDEVKYGIWLAVPL